MDKLIMNAINVIEFVFHALTIQVVTLVYPLTHLELNLPSVPVLLNIMRVVLISVLVNTI